MVDLYYYDVAKKQSKAIASNVLSLVNASADGTKLFYFEDADKDAKTGTLTMHDLKKNVSTQIATDVLTTYPITSYFSNGILDPNAFFYATKGADGGADIHYYNGKRSKVIV